MCRRRDVREPVQLLPREALRLQKPREHLTLFQKQRQLLIESGLNFSELLLQAIEYGGLPLCITFRAHGRKPPEVECDLQQQETSSKSNQKGVSLLLLIEALAAIRFFAFADRALFPTRRSPPSRRRMAWP